MKKLFFYSFLLIILLVTEGISAGIDRETGPSCSQSTPQMRFKLGFEFQEIGSLCPWALNNIHVQRKPLFGVFNASQNLFDWHVVIDTIDLEFVTRPFSDEERAPLESCLQSISEAFSLLKAFLGTNSLITLAQWVSQISDVTLTPDFERVRYQQVVRPHKWNPVFAPQVTIQHPLEWTIPLYNGLFDADSHAAIHFSACFPYRESFIEACKQMNSREKNRILAQSTQKVSGLAFLHALTLVQMTPVDENPLEEDLQETTDNYEKYHQIDAKMRLTLMSRRPFSSMRLDIERHLQISYEQFFQESILKCNNKFLKLYEVPRLFRFTNYGEQFFNPTTGTMISLENILSEFSIDQSTPSSPLMSNLLKNGIITTAMLRCTSVGRDILGTYFESATNLSSESRSRPEVDIKREQGRLISTHYSSVDALSPPWFLSQSDSMGRVITGIPDEEKEFGEAIIEVRSIKSVGIWFLLQMGLTERCDKGVFLTREDFFVSESLCLFDFLCGFTKSKFMDIYSGIELALVRAG